MFNLLFQDSTFKKPVLNYFRSKLLENMNILEINTVLFLIYAITLQFLLKISAVIKGLHNCVSTRCYFSANVIELKVVLVALFYNISELCMIEILLFSMSKNVMILICIWF